MKIIVAGIYPPDVGGPATYAVALERELPKRGIEVQVVPFALVRHLPKVVRHLAYLGKLFAAIRKADVLFVQDAVSSGLPALIAARIAGKPLVVRIGGDFAWEQGSQRFGVEDSLDDFQRKQYGFFVTLLRGVQTFVVQRADEVIAPSHYLGQIVQGWLGESHAVRVIYNGVELPVATEAPKKELPHPLIVTSGRLVPWKEFHEVIEAVTPEQSWHLAIAGDGPERAHLEALAQKEGCADRVHFLGNLSRAEMLGWVSCADAFVLYSSYEGLSHTLIEALSLGTPVIASDIPANAEVIKHKENGILVSPHKPEELRTALAQVLSDTALARQLGKAGTDSAADFSIEKTMDSVAALIKEICA